jgi:hypothetical protein
MLVYQRVCPSVSILFPQKKTSQASHLRPSPPARTSSWFAAVGSPGVMGIIAQMTYVEEIKMLYSWTNHLKNQCSYCFYYYSFLGNLIQEIQKLLFCYNILVGGIPTPLKNMSQSVGIIIPNIWRNDPNVQTTNQIWLVYNWRKKWETSS